MPITLWFATHLLYWLIMAAPAIIVLAYQHGLYRNPDNKVFQVFETLSVLVLIAGIACTVIPILGWLSYLIPDRHGELHELYGKPPFSGVSSYNMDAPQSYIASSQLAAGVYEPIIGIILLTLIALFIMGRMTDESSAEYDKRMDWLQPTMEWEDKLS